VLRSRTLVVAGLWLVPLLGLTARGSEVTARDPRTGQPPPQPPAGIKQVAEKPAACGSFGTAVHFLATPREAAAAAKKEEKLAFILHLSGIFENAEFT
jgi:thiamine biosynthesis lipoprotein ApbE